jgi:CubicO group peptidase (beta-lactamase class C family)
MNDLRKSIVESVAVFTMAALFAACGPTPAPPEQNPSSSAGPRASLAKKATFDAIDADLTALMAHYNLPGLSYAIIKPSGVVHASGLGFRDLSQQAPVDVDTRFRVGSVTKQFTAATIGIATDASDLSLDDLVETVLPVDPDIFNGEKVRVRDLLTHTAGFGNMDGSFVFFPAQNQADILRRLEDLAPFDPPGESFAYSNMGYTLAGMIAANELGYPDNFDAMINDKIFRPLGMTRSTLSIEAMASDNAAQGYAMSGTDAIPVLPEDMKAAGPAGALNSTASDLGKWVQLWLNDGDWEGQRLLSPEFVAAAISAEWEPNPDDNPESLPNGYGFGFFVEGFRGTLRVSHGGNTAGYSALVDFLPEKDIGVAILTNQDTSDAIYYAANIIYAHMLDFDRPIMADIEPKMGAARTDISAEDEPLDIEKMRPFIGTYAAPGYGVVEIARDDQTLVARLPDFTLSLSHQQEDQFILGWREGAHQNIPSFNLSFVRNTSGQIEGFTLPLRHGDEFFRRLD